MQTRRFAIGAAVAACAVGGVTAAVVEGAATAKRAVSAHSASQGPRMAGPQAGAPPGIPGGPHAVHSVSVVLDKAGTGFVTQTTDRGKIQSVDASARTITLVEGTKSLTYRTPTVTIAADATVALDGKSSSLGDLAAGDHVSIDSSSDGASVFATDSSFHPEGGPGMGGPPPANHPAPSE
jgi:hypothetical protein